MSKRVSGLALAALSACGLAFAAPATSQAADYYQPPPPPPQQVYYPPPPPPVQSCCCPTVRRGFAWNFSSCGYRGGYEQYPQYQQSYQAPAYYPQQPYAAYQPSYYQPGYAPRVGVGVGVGVGPVGVGVGVGARVGYRRY